MQLHHYPPPRLPGRLRDIPQWDATLPPEGWAFHSPRPLYPNCSWCGREHVELSDGCGASLFICPECDGGRV